MSPLLPLERVLVAVAIAAVLSCRLTRRDTSLPRLAGEVWLLVAGVVGLVQLAWIFLFIVEARF